MKERNRSNVTIVRNVFSSKISLNLHILSIHEGQIQFSCDICDQNFTSKYCLKRHTASIHEGKKPLKCDVGETSFFIKT